MNIIPIELKLPDIFYELEEKLLSFLEPNSFVIAGGSLCDIYMGNNFKDIDVFIKESDFKIDKLKEVFQTTIKAFDLRCESYFGSDTSFIFHLNYKGVPIELISVTSIYRVYDFDYRFRQFYFYNHQVFSTKEALEDIKNKELVLVNPYSGLSSLCRYKYFEKRYGFSMKEESLSYLYWFLTKDQILYQNVIKYISQYKKLDEKQKNDLLRIVSKETKIRKAPFFGFIDDDESPRETAVFQYNSFPFSSVLEDTLFRYLKLQNFNHRHDAGIIGPGFSQMKQFKETKLFQDFSFRLTKENSERYFREFFDKCFSYYLEYRLYFVSHGNKQKLLNVFDLYKKESKNENFDHFYFYFEHFEALSRFIKALDDFFERYDQNYDSLLINIQNMNPAFIDETFQVSFQTEYDHMRFGDLLYGHSFCLHIESKMLNYPLSLRMRRCENGKFTLSSVMSGGNLIPTQLFLSPIFNYLLKHYPEYFEFYRDDLIGIYHVSSNPVDHFFPAESMYYTNRSNVTFEPNLCLTRKVPIKL